MSNGMSSRNVRKELQLTQSKTKDTYWLQTDIAGLAVSLNE